ncbi:threonine/serine exporter ThrE family protein [Psychromicrobium sp. YIM B11713]|uniref:threonine/serine ThrE exporter family protein n=1 Tax=Psychromicrobium sp. YIM B11713 TaxID=3145233 RepID=UPI00374ECFCD
MNANDGSRHDDQGPAAKRDQGRPAEARPTSKQIPSVQRSRENFAARRGLRRLVQSDAPPTAPMSIVDRLAGSPYANPMIQVGGVDNSARKTIDFTLLLAETMFRFGAGALEVETSMIAVTAAFGLRNIEVDITNQSVSINYAPKNATPITLLRVVRSWTNNYAGLTQVHQLVTEIVSGGVGREEAQRRLNDILRRPKPYQRWMVTTSSGVFAACVVAVIGGGLAGALIAMGSTLLVGLLSRWLSRWRVPDFFITATGAFLVTAIALAFVRFEIPIQPGAVVTGGILLLLPSGRLVSAVQDAINGFPVTAAGRFLSVFLTFGAIVSGIAVASAFGVLLGANAKSVIDAPKSEPLPLYLALLLILFATVLIGVVEQTSPRLLIPTAMVGVLGYSVFFVVGQLGLGTRLAPAVAAAVVGILARLIALRLGAPQLVVAVPSILFLLAGLSIFRAMFVLTISNDSALDGVIGLFNAIVVIMGVAAGVVLGDNLARPLTKLGKLSAGIDPRRNRRR